MIENTDSDQSEPIKYKGQVHYKLTSFRKPRPDQTSSNVFIMNNNQ